MKFIFYPGPKGEMTLVISIIEILVIYYCIIGLNINEFTLKSVNNKNLHESPRITYFVSLIISVSW
jgi:hypothetical protein